jgi:hypothetical protein
MIRIQFNELVTDWLANAIGCTDETAVAEGQELFSLMVASGALTDDTDALRARLAVAERLAEATDSLLETLQNLADIPSMAVDLLVFAEYAEARAALAEWQALNVSRGGAMLSKG